MIHACELCKFKNECLARPTSNCADCDRFVREEPQTNADRIRAMTDEELAEFFFGRFAKWNEECDKDKLADYMFTRKERFLQWLKQEVKE